MLQLRSRDYRRLPWRNGRGSTAEIAVAPAGAGIDDFLWRVSTAVVAAPGAFSAFPGVDRILTVISGDGLTLEIDGHAPAAPGQEPFAFPGDLPCNARLRDGPVTDLNVMTRRGQCRAVVRWAGPAEALPGASDRLVFAGRGPLDGRVGGRGYRLDAGDTLRLSGPDVARLELAGIWLDIQIIPGGL